MKKPQYILILFSLITIALLYLLGNRVPPMNSKNADSQATRDGEASNKGGGMQMQAVPPAEFEEIKAKALAQLNTDDKELVEKLGQNMTKDGFHALCDFWTVKNNYNLAANYKGEQAKLENSEKSLTFAGQYFIDLLNQEQDANIKSWQASKAVKNPNNTNAKIAMATCYAEGTGEVMKGVQLLLGVVRQDSTNILATMVLGKLAIKSQQYDKAIVRFEKILRIDPKNTEAMYHLAEVYKNTGNIAKAKDLLNTCKKVVDNPKFTKEIDDYIKTF
jgi:tetratricopeptide (TPR) repeat protein